METPTPQRLVERFLRASLLDRDVFAEVAAHRGAGGQAFLVVVLGGVCNALGQGRAMVWSGVPADLATVWVIWILWTLVVPLSGWLLWTLTVLVVARLFGQSAGYRSLLRALGFANAPAAALLLRIVPGIGPAVHVIVVLWLLAASAAAVEAVFAVSRRRAVVIAAIAFAIYLLAGVGLQTWAMSAA